MPLPMVHLNIAKRIVDLGYKVNKMPQFYLGIISPDAIHMRKDSDRTHKNDTHLLPEGKKWSNVDEKEYFIFMKNFFSKNIVNVDNDFLRGYGLHIITDMMWSKQVYIYFEKKYEQDPSPIQEIRMAYYNDTDILDQVIFNESYWKNDVWEKLIISESDDFIDYLSKEEIELWKERTLHWFDEGVSRHKNPIRYIFREDIDIFVENSVDLIMEEEIY